MERRKAPGISLLALAALAGCGGAGEEAARGPELELLSLEDEAEACGSYRSGDDPLLELGLHDDGSFELAWSEDDGAGCLLELLARVTGTWSVTGHVVLLREEERQVHSERLGELPPVGAGALVTAGNLLAIELASRVLWRPPPPVEGGARVRAVLARTVQALLDESDLPRPQRLVVHPEWRAGRGGLPQQGLLEAWGSPPAPLQALYPHVGTSAPALTVDASVAHDPRVILSAADFHAVAAASPGVPVEQVQFWEPVFGVRGDRALVAYSMRRSWNRHAAVGLCYLEDGADGWSVLFQRVFAFG